MSGQRCQDFWDWLERVPRRELAPSFEDHLKGCECCQDQIEQLGPVIELLSSESTAIQAGDKLISRCTARAQDIIQSRNNRRLALGLTVVATLSLPVIVLVNWLWAFFSYTLIATYMSPVLAQIYLLLFIVTTLGISSISYGSLPLLAGWFCGHSTRGNK